MAIRQPLSELTESQERRSIQIQELDRELSHIGLTIEVNFSLIRPPLKVLVPVILVRPEKLVTI